MDREQIIAYSTNDSLRKNTIRIAVFLKKIGKFWLKWGG